MVTAGLAKDVDEREEVGRADPGGNQNRPEVSAAGSGEGADDKNQSSRGHDLAEPGGESITRVGGRIEGGQFKHHVGQRHAREAAEYLEDDVGEALTGVDLALDQRDRCYSGVEVGTRNRAEHPDEHAQGEDRAECIEYQDDSVVVR